MGTKKKPAPRRKGPATGNGKPAVKVQAPRPRTKRPIALTVLFILFVVFVLALVARSAV